MTRYAANATVRRNSEKPDTWWVTWAEANREYQKLPTEWFRPSDPRSSDRITTIQFTEDAEITVTFQGRLLPEVEKSLTITLDCYGRVITLPGPYFSNTGWFVEGQSYATGEYTWTVKRCNFDKFIENLPIENTAARFFVDYPGSYQRVKDELTYPFDGVISEGDDWEALRREMDIGMAGNMIDRNGSLYMLPGAFRTPVANLGERDTVEVIEWNTRASIENTSNRITMQLNSSDGNNLQREEIRPYQDKRFLEQDRGLTIDVDSGILPFNVSRRSAGRLQAVNLKKARGEDYGIIRILPGEDMENWSIFAGDYITYSNSKFNLNNKLCFVTSSTFANDLTVVLGLKVETSDTYNDVVVNPYPPSTKIEYASNTDPEGPPSNLNNGVTAPRSPGGYGGGAAPNPSPSPNPAPTPDPGDGPGR